MTIEYIEEAPIPAGGGIRLAFALTVDGITIVYIDGAIHLRDEPQRPDDDRVHQAFDSVSVPMSDGHHRLWWPR